jgi:hypothetical protein
VDQPTTQSERTIDRRPNGHGSTGRGALVWVALVALVVGAAAGFVGGRLSTGSGDDSTTLEAVGADAGAGAAFDTPAAAGSTLDGSPATTAAGGAFSSMGGQPAFEEPSMPAERLFKRTAGGAELRVTRAAGPRCTGEGCPPPECLPVGFVTVIAIEEWDVGGGGASMWAEPEGPARIIGTVVASGSLSGSASTSFLGGLIVQTSRDVARVRLIDPRGGVLDEMAPVGGIAVVVTRITTASTLRGPIERLDAVVESLDAAGRVLARSSYDELANGPSKACVDRMRPPSSSPPATVAPPKPALPAPGEQPADRASAERAVRAAFDAALGGRGTAEANANIDDPDGLQEARDASAKAFPQYAEPGTVRFVLDELVFTGPTRASYSYRAVVSADGMVLLSNIGTARLVDGRWLITRATMCQILPTKPPGTC